ncbi:iron chelate uptake ABC transporter family permease subunit [Sediminibacillus dalangtanensis]|uniref:Iron chelate uptake ABC transporter family permease subunit n=1 Tax=Sediminibacillus dalangtanensis TaxID=2729421 RepID=A0ABX7VSC9_9BACI|nr:iron ABC transporter permease [Sediminibacillus dalangtanensis]QTM98480.1 iron chelate uptake ABC transporter family permease subunit [Sediminibacillus dalangtanensis]
MANITAADKGPRPLLATVILIGGLAVLLLTMGLSILYGAADVKYATIWQSIYQFDASSTSHQIIRNLRIPRALAAALIGAALAMSGAIMQGMTRNPLASPSIMGVTSGAAFMMAVALVITPGASNIAMMLWAFAGAGLGTGIVFAVGSISKTGLTPVKLALAGTAVTAMLNSLSSGISIHFNIAKDMSFWYAGGVSSVQWVHVKLLAPVVIIGIILALLLAHSITVMNLGEDVARGLGQRTGLIKFAGTIVVLLLTGVAVSVAGTIGFIGLVIPHITRFLVGINYRWIIPCSAILGAILLVAADTVSRMINPPFETPVGTVTALIGVPFFLYLARREGRSL